MVDPLDAISEIIDPDKIRIYYSVFINTLAAIARNFNAKIIKNTASSLIFYFPKTSTVLPLVSSWTSDKWTSPYESAFRDVIECGITMIAARDFINSTLKEEGGLPSMCYKISADYGRVEVARSLGSPNTEDLFGSTMNICAKINSMASANGMVIGSELYYIVRGLLTTTSANDSDHNFNFRRIGEYPITSNFEKHLYPVYSVISTRNNNKNTLNLYEQIPKLKEQVQIQIQQEYAVANQQQQLKKDSDIPTISYKDNQQQLQQKEAHNILLVDDEPDTLITYKAFLLTAGQGYNIDTFTDSQMALQQFAQISPSYYDLVVMDIRMPGLNGLQLYNRFKVINPDTKVLFVSDFDAAQDIVSMLPYANTSYDIVEKPVEREQFLYIVKRILSTSSSSTTTTTTTTSSSSS